MDPIAIFMHLLYLRDTWRKVRAHCHRELPPDLALNPGLALRQAVRYALLSCACSLGAALGAWLFFDYLVRGNPTLVPAFLGFVSLALLALAAACCVVQSMGSIIDWWRARAVHAALPRGHDWGREHPIRPA